MNKKLTFLLFSLLLAVGWTSDAQAQQSEMRIIPKMALAKSQVKVNGEAIPRGALKANAPLRSQNYDLNATAVHPKSWYESQDPVTWGNNSALLTDTYTDAKGMMALLKRIYTDRNIPGAKYSAPNSCDLPYQTIQHGWDIIGNTYDEDVVIEIGPSVRIISIEIWDANFEEFYSWVAPNSGYNANLPSDWTTSKNMSRYTWYNQYYTYYMNGGGTITIPARYLQNSTGVAHIMIGAGTIASTPTEANSLIKGSCGSFGHAEQLAEAGSDLLYYLGFSVPGKLTPPDENGYTVCLVKLNDGINNDPEVTALEYTTTTEELEDYFTTYIKEIQLLTDGMRVGEGGDNPGTIFSYTGDLNRFFFLGKGKMFYYSSIDGLNYDRAPFYSMYEEFSANDVDDSSGYDDFYTRMKNKESYPILHDCMGVNFRQHYFSMSGKNGTTENHVSSLVFFIPDYRGVEGSEWRTYDENHQPEIGMYIITLDAEAQASTTPEMYTVTVTWESNLSDITGNDIVQSYRLFEIVTAPDGTVTTREIELPDPHDTSYTYDVDQYDSSYKITYYVIGTPDDATNKDVFFSQSNDDFVVIPGLNDFIGLELKRYESDYVVSDDSNNEVNYYRNFLAPKNLDALGLSGVTAANVGTDGRTFTLYRDDNAIADIEIIMQGEKAYYRITYREGFQHIEPGYDENGNKTNN